ncbi:MAG TPA: hypothetical protein VNZ45_13035, partial [Bacteroidia bacterium]|nr:hypothetical protein [Bacteroidia bacterium]
MKKVYKALSIPTCILTTLASVFIVSAAYGQTAQNNNTIKQKKGVVTKWTQNPYDHTIFIENRGQFNKDVPADNKVLFQAMLGNIDAYFTTNGIVYRWDEQIKESGEEKNDPDAIKIEHKMHYCTMYWEDCNPNVSVDAKEERKDYYIYPVTASSSINVNLFKKIVYRNLYPGIDAEFVFPKGGKTGIKYSLIVHRGADLSKVKIKYSGSNGMKLDGEGNVVIQSEMQDFTEHAPSSFYENDNREVSAEFVVNNNEESFKVKDLDNSKTLVIDPWLTNPLYTYATNSAYDLDFDNNGNVYAYGGCSPYQLVQMNSLGAIQWTYNATPFNTGYYGDVVVGRKTGTSYLVEGFNGSGARVEKINSLGALVGTYPGTSNLVEMWRAEYNPCNDNIVIAAGGTTADNQACMLDTNMVTITPVNVLSSGTALHDMSLIGIDPSGKFAYMGTAQSVVYPTVFNNVIMQLPIPTLSPTTYLKYDGLAFKEVGSIAYVAPATGRANGMNGMAASPNWLYVYDGSYLKERNKATGAEVDSVFVTNTSFQWGGLDVDACDNIYAGFKDSIYVYNVSLAVTNKIALTNTVYDVVLGQSDLLYACGKGFVTSMSVPAPSKLISTAAGTPTSCAACDGKATVTVNCGVAPFSYLWSNGSTGSIDSNLCAG